MIHFCLYGDLSGRGISLPELLAVAKESGDGITARAEYSGCEGCYIEVARWSDKRRRWERYCFEKVFGGEHSSDPSRPENGDHPNCLGCLETAALFAKEINEVACNHNGSLIHNMPNWEGQS
jgi:hypothetical protein